MQINITVRGTELGAIFRHSRFQRRVGSLPCCIIPQVLDLFHAAQFRPAHRAEVGDPGAFGRQGFVMIFERCFRVEREGALVSPAEIEAGVAQGFSAFGLGRAAAG